MHVQIYAKLMKKQKENSHEGITWSEMGKQNVQAEKVYWGQCKLKLTQIKSYQMQAFEKRGKSLGAEKRTNKLNPHMKPSLGIEPGPH